jgi:hypothetical protein
MLTPCSINKGDTMNHGVPFIYSDYISVYLIIQ